MNRSEAEKNNNVPEEPRPTTFKLKGLVRKANSAFISIPQQQGCKKQRSGSSGKRKGLKRCLNGISSPNLLGLGCSKRRSNRRKPSGGKQRQPRKVKVVKVKSEQAINQTENEKNTYERLMLSLGSPLPNEHELSLGTCLRLSAVGNKVTQEVNLIGNNPAILRMLLAHAGFYEDCGLRALMEETCLQAFDLNFALFWEELCGSDHQLQGLLCECYQGELTKLTEEEKEIWLGVNLKNEDGGIIGSARLDSLKCCSGCQQAPALAKMELDSSPEIPFTLSRSSGHFSEKLINRVQLVGTILSNFSFQSKDAIVMAGSATMLRFLLVSAQIQDPTISRLAFDIISNISKYMGTSKTNVAKSVEWQQLAISIAHLVMKTVFSSPDRLKLIRGLEALEGFAKGEDKLLKSMVARSALFARVLQLLTMNQDILLVTVCLNCLLAMTEIGNKSCEDIVHVPGSIATLISYLTVDFLGPKSATDKDVNAELAKTSSNISSGISPAQHQKYEDLEILSSIAPPSSSTTGISRTGLNYVADNRSSLIPEGSHPVNEADENKQPLIDVVTQKNLNNAPLVHQQLPGNGIQKKAYPPKSRLQMMQININGNIRVVNAQLISNGNQIYLSLDQIRKELFRYPCQWEVCRYRAETIQMLRWHIYKQHYSNLPEVTCCYWALVNPTPEQIESCSVPRGKLSLLTHLERCHYGSKLELDLQCPGLFRSKQKDSSAIIHEQMHSNFVPDEKCDSAQEEHPVIKSVRLTAAITLRNLANSSSSARRSLALYESHLVEMLTRGCDCSAMVAKILHCISLGNDQEEDF